MGSRARAMLIVLLAATFNVSFTQDDNTISETAGEERERQWYTRLRYPRRDSVRRQPQLKGLRFPCANETEHVYERARSVHALRPSDVTVVGAMGDSLVAGNGALEEFALGAIVEYRGVSWCAGGEGTWREYLTLPNILKEFNPDLRGYSTGTGEFLVSGARFNVAFPVSSDADALQQAKLLVRRMRADRGMDFENDWKMVTVMFGANDLCSARCYASDDSWSPSAHAAKLARALDYLRDHMPRTFVNLVPVVDVSVSVRVRRSLACRLMHMLFCACLHRNAHDVEDASVAALAYQRAEEELIASGRYDGREDFTVVLQPFIKLFNAPSADAANSEPAIHSSYVTHDCFHFSQKGHALAANLIWNNLLQPVGHKSTHRPDHVLQEFLCPSERAPYFFTARNTRSFLLTGRQ